MASGPDETLAASTAAPASRELVSGARLGKYKLERVLGEGGMGVVWAAHDPDLERAVALKVLRYERASLELRQRLLREARAMAKLKHPNVLTVYEVGTEGDRDFIAMELVDGASLDSWHATKPARDDLWHTVIAAGRGLAAAHRAGLVHRDFKPHNVLRGSDGRVLVTDFGLARGHDGAAPSPAVERTLPAIVSGLEATLEVTPSIDVATTTGADLTRTGALLGTPAYMAPEQFAGAASDPRTDQFAFCVTAWQLLAGERPYRGDTIDELRKAASAGVANVKGDLPSAVRGVLARGLDPDPAKRWPDMNALLAALERARGRTGRRVRLAAVGVAVVGSGALAAKMFLFAPAKHDAEGTCDKPPEVEIARAWSPEQRDKLHARFGDNVGSRLAIDHLDEFASRWVTDYRNACAGPRGTRTFARLGCLLGERDHVTGMTDLMKQVPPNVIEGVEMGGMLPRPQACEGESPVAPPTLPDDPQQRQQIYELRPRLVAAYWTPANVMLPQLPDLLKQAEALGYAPLIAEAHHSWGLAAARDADWVRARDEYARAVDYAGRAHDLQLQATAAVELTLGELQAASVVSDDGKFADLVAQTRRYVHDAGDDPHLLAQLDDAEAAFAANRGNLDDAIAHEKQALQQERDGHNWPEATRAAAELVHLLLRRDRAGDLDAAWRECETVAQVKLAPYKYGPVAIYARYLALLRGDPAAAHAWMDRFGEPSLPDGATVIGGRVVDAAGKPVAGATVVAWTGLLIGDPTRAYLGPDSVGARTTTGPDGAFSVRGVPAGGIIAELGAQRSQPRVIGDGAVTLALASTREVAGTVVATDEVLTGVLAIAHYKLAAGLAWDVRVPVTRTHAFTLAGLPGGAATLRLSHWLDPNASERKLDFGPIDTAKPAWPSGPAIDGIVRGIPDATLWVLRGKQVVKTRAAIEALDASDVTAHPALVIGMGDSTPEGMKLYQRDDLHGVMIANAPGWVTVCAAAAGPATCKQIEIPAVKPESRDGHAVYPTIPVVLTPP